MTRDGDFSWVAELLGQQRDVVLDRWLEAAAAQPFHHGRRERAVANHIPNLVDALIALLYRTSSRAPDAGASMNEPAVLVASQEHARTRVAHGLAASDIITEFRLLRQEIGWALRLHVTGVAPTADVLGAEMLLHDALDDAVYLAVLAMDQHEAELRRLREALAAEELRLAILLEQLPASVIMVDAPSGQVALGHPVVKRLTTRPGLPVPAGENPNDWQGYRRDGRRYTPEEWPLARAVRTGEVVTGEEIDYLRDDGKRGTVSVNAAPVRDPAGLVVAAVAIFTDVTDRKTLEQEKEAFLTAITHDLFSPLTAIKGSATLLQRDALHGPVPHQRLMERLRWIEVASTRMSTQLIELQDIARLRTGQAIKLQYHDVDPAILVQDCAARHQASSQNHEIVVDLTGLDGAAIPGRWDEARLDRVLDNLIGNALKFSPHGGRITLALTRELQEAATPRASLNGNGAATSATRPTANAAIALPMAVLRITDQGIGIPPDDLPHIFDWFRRASNTAGKIAGTGIGLAAARQIIELHGGTIIAESPDGNGTTFTVRLPLAFPNTQPQA